MVKDYYDVRAVFKKTGRAIYISHLDLMRVMQRTFKRAKLPVWFTKGYNPHIYLMFALPLSLGVSSECELMDFGIDISAGELDYEDIKNRLNQVLPEGLEIVKLYEPNPNVLVFSIENSSSGELQRENGRIRSTKHSGCGIGTESAQNIAKRYNGVLNIENKDGVFRVSGMLSSV